MGRHRRAGHWVVEYRDTCRVMKQILLVGLPRSGTTWIAKVIDSAPDVFYLHEPDSEFRIPCVPFAPNPEDYEHWLPFIDDYLEKLPLRGSTRTCGKRPSFSKSHYSNAFWSGRILSRRVAEKLGFRQKSFAIPKAKTASNTTLVWKSIESLGRVGGFAETQHSLRILQIVRHPCGFIDSVLRGEQGGRFTKNASLTQDFGLFEIIARSEVGQELGLSLGRLVRCSSIERLAWFWTVLNTKAARELRRQPHAHAISYDALCVDSLPRMRSLFEQLGLVWQDQTEAFVEQSTQAQGTDYYSVKRQSSLACNAWRQQMSDRDVA